MATPTNLHDTATSFLAAFTDLSDADHLSLRGPECTQIFAPSSLAVPQKSNEQFASHVASLRKIISRFPVTAKEIRINCGLDQTTNKADNNGNPNAQITIWATGQPEFREEVKRGQGKEEEEVNWEVINEYIFILDVDVETGKIVRVLEFLDSAQTEKLRALVRRARENLGVVERGEWG